MTKIAFLGAGNMAAAMVNGLLAQDPAQRASISCLGGSGRTAAALASRTGIALAAGLPELILPADVVVIAFKPQHLASADSRLAELTRGKLVLSVLAGKTLATLAQAFPHARNLVRTMPNTPAAIGAAITPYCAQQPLTPADRAAVESLLGACGRFVEIVEAHMNAVTAVSGSGPAFLFEFVAALRDGGVAAGLSRELASQLAVETALGASKLLAHRQTDPEVLRNEVTSPNGTTMAGLKQLESGDLRGLIRATVLAAQARAAELSRGS